MTFTTEQMTTLSSFERFFDTAINASWASYPGQAAVQTIHAILEDATGKKYPLRVSCGTCVLLLLQDVGRIYFKDKEEAIAKANDALAVQLTKKDAKPRKKAVKQAKNE